MLLVDCYWLSRHTPSCVCSSMGRPCLGSCRAVSESRCNLFGCSVMTAATAPQVCACGCCGGSNWIGCQPQLRQVCSKHNKGFKAPRGRQPAGSCGNLLQTANLSKHPKARSPAARHAAAAAPARSTAHGPTQPQNPAPQACVQAEEPSPPAGAALLPPSLLLLSSAGAACLKLFSGSSSPVFFRKRTLRPSGVTLTPTRLRTCVCARFFSDFCCARVRGGGRRGGKDTGRQDRRQRQHRGARVVGELLQTINKPVLVLVQARPSKQGILPRSLPAGPLRAAVYAPGCAHSSRSHVMSECTQKRKADAHVPCIPTCCVVL